MAGTTDPMQRALTIQHRTALLRDALAVMEADYGASLDLDDVARRVATSRRQLQRCFREYADATFREVLTRIRMDNAARLLAGTDLSVREVSQRVGYRQPAQFAKAFRRRHGRAPSAYRDARAVRRLAPPARAPVDLFPVAV